LIETEESMLTKKKQRHSKEESVWADIPEHRS